MEPQPRAPVPSFEEHGFQRGGVLENMQALGVLPSKKLRDRVKSRALRRSAREEYLKFDEGASTTPEGTPPIDPIILEPVTAADTGPAMARNREEDEDDDYNPGGVNGTAARSGKLPAKIGGAASPTKLGRPSLPQGTLATHKPSAFHSVFNEQTLSGAVEIAAAQTDLEGQPRLGRALLQMYEESQHDHKLAALLDAILLQNPTIEERTQFQAQIKRIKKQIKANDKISRRGAKSVNKSTMPARSLLSSRSPSTTKRMSSIKARQSLENIFIPSSVNNPSFSPGYSSQASASPVSPIPRLPFPFANGIDTDMVDWNIQTRAAKKRATAGSSSASAGPSTAGNSPPTVPALGTSSAPSSAAAQRNDSQAQPSTAQISSHKTKEPVSRKSITKKASNAATPDLTDAESSTKADERNSTIALDTTTSAGPYIETRANKDTILPSTHSSFQTISSVAAGAGQSASQSVTHSPNHSLSIHASSEGAKPKGRKVKSKAVFGKDKTNSNINEQSITPSEGHSRLRSVGAGSKRKADEADLDTEGETAARRQEKYRENHKRLETELQTKKAAAARAVEGRQANAEYTTEDSNIRNEEASRRTRDLQDEPQLPQVTQNSSAGSQTPVSSGLSSPPSEALRAPSETPSVVAGPSTSAPSRTRQHNDLNETEETDSIDLANTQITVLDPHIHRATRGNRASKRHKPDGAQTKLSEMYVSSCWTLFPFYVSAFGYLMISSLLLSFLFSLT